MEDYIIRGLAFNDEVRFFAAYTKNICEESRNIHGTSPICTAALGRLLTAGAMMGSMCKNDTDLITIQIKGDGPAKGLTVTADAKANVKGIIYNPIVTLPANEAKHLNVGGAIGHGSLSVIKDIGMKDPYVGQTQLVSGEVAEDLTYYFAVSEQIPTSVGLGVLMTKENTVEHAGGFIIQLLPFASSETVNLLEERLGKVKSVTEFFKEGKSVEEMMKEILGDDMRIEDKIPTQYKCNCSRERVKKALISIGKKEIESMVEEGKPVTLNCDFCNTEYTFEIEELKEILAE